MPSQLLSPSILTLGFRFSSGLFALRLQEGVFKQLLLQAVVAAAVIAATVVV